MTLALDLIDSACTPPLRFAQGRRDGRRRPSLHEQNRSRANLRGGVASIL